MPTVQIGALTIAYDASVLEPRPWTARQSEWAADLLSVAPAGRMLELCAGAGQIGLLALLNAQQGTRYLELAEGRTQNRSFIFGWLKRIMP